MRKSQVIFLSLLLLPFSASADYFQCQIEQMGSVLAAEEAEYRVVEASVSADGFLCEGRINSLGETEVRLTDLEGHRTASSTEKGSKASTYLPTVPRHNELDVICTCGMQ